MAIINRRRTVKNIIFVALASIMMIYVICLNFKIQVQFRQTERVPSDYHVTIATRTERPLVENVINKLNIRNSTNTSADLQSKSNKDNNIVNVQGIAVFDKDQSFDNFVDGLPGLGGDQGQVGPAVKPEGRWVHRSHNESLQQKQAAILKEKVKTKLCELWPRELVGEMNVHPGTTLADVKLQTTQLAALEKGGKYRPRDCQPREKTAVIIPYRDRKEHLEILLHHLHAVLQRQNIEYGIFVLELAYPTQFNRGLLANAGFLTAGSIADYTCYVIHDVDLLMVNDKNLYRCGRVPRHLEAYCSKYDGRLPYVSYFGGIVAFTADQFWKMNGFSNLYFGWGGEDDDILARLIASGFHFSRPKLSIGGYVALGHDKDSSNPKNPNRITLVRSAARRKDVEGLRNVPYRRLALEFKPLYTWVYIKANEAATLEKYNEYLAGPDVT